jgi:hypothetical protein
MLQGDCVETQRRRVSTPETTWDYACSTYNSITHQSKETLASSVNNSYPARQVIFYNEPRDND